MGGDLSLQYTKRGTWLLEKNSVWLAITVYSDIQLWLAVNHAWGRELQLNWKRHPNYFILLLNIRWWTFSWLTIKHTHVVYVGADTKLILTGLWVFFAKSQIEHRAFFHQASQTPFILKYIEGFLQTQTVLPLRHQSLVHGIWQLILVHCIFTSLINDWLLLICLKTVCNKPIHKEERWPP